MTAGRKGNFKQTRERNLQIKQYILLLVYCQQWAHWLPYASSNTQMLKVKTCLHLLPRESEEIRFMKQGQTFSFSQGSRGFSTVGDKILCNINCQTIDTIKERARAAH